MTFYASSSQGGKPTWRRRCTRNALENVVFGFVFWCGLNLPVFQSREFGQDKSGLTAEDNQSSTRLQNRSWNVGSKSSSFEIRVLLKKVLCLFESKKLCSSIFFDVQCYNVSIRLSEDMYKRSWHSKTTWTSWVSSIRDRRRERSGSPLSPELSPLPWRPHVCGRSFSRIIWFDNDLISFLSSFVFYFLCSFWIIYCSCHSSSFKRIKAWVLGL